MQEQELFQSYEVKNWDFSPRIYKILAVSAIFNILALLVVAQTNLLTRKGCESPLVGGVCQVLDTLYVSGTAITTDTRYVNGPDEETGIDDAEIIWVDRTGDDKFKYPENYFGLSNPGDPLAMNTSPYEIPGDGSFPANIPGITPPTTGGGTTSLMDQPQVLPEANKNARPNELPSSPFGFDNNPTVSKPNKQLSYRPPKKYPRIQTPNTTSPNKLPELTADTENKEQKTDKTPDTNKVDEIVINKTPLKTFAADVKKQVDDKAVDLTQNFKVIAEGALDKDGKLTINTDKKTKKPILIAEGNEQMVTVASNAIAAVGASGFLVYLRNQGVEKIKFMVVQDNDNLQVIITSDLPTPERANTVTSGVGGVISTALLFDKNGLKKLGEDEKVLLSNAKAVVNPTNQKQFVLNFVLPKATAQEMITRKLNEKEENPTDPKKNGNTGQITKNNQATAK